MDYTLTLAAGKTATFRPGNRDREGLRARKVRPDQLHDGVMHEQHRPRQ